MTAADASAPPRKGGFLRDWAPTLLFSVVLPIVTYNVLTSNGMKTTTALLVSSAWAAFELGLHFLLHRRLDELAMLALVVMLLGFAGQLISDSERFAVLKDSAITGLIGVAMFASLLAPRPFAFYFGRKFATGGAPERVEWWNGLWRFPGFRSTQRTITAVWGAGFLLDAGVRTLLGLNLTTDAMVTINAVMPLAVTAALVTWTIRFSRAKAKAAREANPDAAAPA